MARLQTAVLLTMMLAGVVSTSDAFLPAPALQAVGAGSSLEVDNKRGRAAAIRPAVDRETSSSPFPVAASPPCHSSANGGSKRPRTAMKATARQVTAEELEREMTDWDLPLILDVFAVWCGPCLMLKPEIEKVAQALDGKCRVLKMDSDDESDMASTLNVYGLPTVLYMKNGVMKHRTEGSMPAEEILQLADIHLFGAAPPADPADDLFIDTSSACEPVGAASSACAPNDAAAAAAPAGACAPSDGSAAAPADVAAASSACEP